MSTLTPTTAAALLIHLEYGHTPAPECSAVPDAEYGAGYYAEQREPLSVAVLPRTGHQYEMATCSRVVRQNARVAERAGYTYRRIDRADWVEDLHALRSSAPERQGRPMPPAYMERQDYGSDIPPVPACRRHAMTVHGVLSPAGALVAYAQTVQCGEVVRFNTILGHAEHLGARVMWSLCLRLLQWHIDDCGAGYALYYAHDSGAGGGLRYFKERFGFHPTRVLWV